jgi:phage terminase small subunit
VARRNVLDKLSADTAAANAGGELPPRMARFCLEYVIDLNGARAARAAGYSAKRDKQTAHELLKRPDIRKRLDADIGAYLERVEFTKDAVIRQLGAILNANLRDIVTIKDGRVLLRKEADIPPEAWLAISEISKDKDGRVRVKLHNKLGAINYMGQAHKLWDGAGVGQVNITVRLERNGAPGIRKVG